MESAARHTEDIRLAKKDLLLDTAVHSPSDHCDSVRSYFGIGLEFSYNRALIEF